MDLWVRILAQKSNQNIGFQEDRQFFTEKWSESLQNSDHKFVVGARITKNNVL
jgi:hypothetical protein